MIVRVQRGKSGYSNYLITGDKRDSIYTRDEKDNIVTLYGNLDTFKQTEEYLNKHKNYKDNYLMIVISFSRDDMKMMENMTNEEVLTMKRDITLTYIKHHTSGYDLDNEVIAYAEEHQPKIKIDEKGNGRYNHIHLGIALYNPLDDTKLRTTFAKNTYIDDTLQTYINKKYGLSIPREHQRERQGINADTQIAKDRKFYKEELKDIKSNNELIKYFKDNNIQYREVKTKSNQYYKIINRNSKDINLRGKGFEHIQNMTIDKNFVYNENKDISELEDVLNSYHDKREKQIDKRRSKSTKEALNKLNKAVGKVDYLYTKLANATYQQQLFYNQYKHLVNNDLKGYSVNTNDDEITRFINKSKNIHVVDNGDDVTSTQDTDNIEERISLMLDIAEAKGWDISDLMIKGNDEDIAELEKQIAERIKARTPSIKNTLSFTEEEAVKQQINKRPITAAQNYKKLEIEKQEIAKVNSNISLKTLKQNLNANIVLSYAIDKYKLNKDNYTIEDDNKINNINNRQKPKNVIDFLCKEVNLKTSEAVNICRDLYNNQPLRVNSTKNQILNNKDLKNGRIKYKKIDTKQRGNVLYKPSDLEAIRAEQTENTNDMRALSESHMVYNAKPVKLLLPIDELPVMDQRSRKSAVVEVRRTNTSDTSARSRERKGEVGMGLKISVTDDKKALNNFKQVEVKSYSELVALMKTKSYSLSNYGTNLSKVGNQRHQANVTSYNNLLIYDIDNDPDDKHLTINEAKQLLKEHNISAIILPSKSNQIEKFTDSGKSKGIVDRYRIIIPTKTPLNSDLDKDTYREFQRLTAKALKIDEYVDNNALNDTSRFYYKSPIQAVPIVIKSDRVMDIENLQSKAIENIKAKILSKQQEQEKANELKANIQKYKVVPIQDSNSLTYANVNKIINIDISKLINHFEQDVNNYKEGNYDMIKTALSKYSIIDNNVAHDFKNSMTYNSLTYLQHKLNMTNLNNIARELENLTKEDFILINLDKVKDVITKAKKIATNDKTFENYIKTAFSVKYAKLEKDSIKIADKEINLIDLDINKQQIVNNLIMNRNKQNTNIGYK